MTPETFYSMEYLVFEEALYQHSLEVESNVKTLWEISRFSTGTLLRPNLKDSNVPLDQIIPLPWDNEQEIVEKELNRKAVGSALSKFFNR